MGLQGGTAKKYAISSKNVINNNRIIANRVVISGVDISQLSSNART